MPGEGWIVRALAGDERAFIQLLDAYEQPVFAYFRRRRVDAGAAEELTHQVFVSLLDGGQRFDPKLGSLAGFIFGIARRVWLRWQSGRNRQTVPLSPDLIDECVEPAARVENSEQNALLRRAIVALTEPMREILELRVYQQLPIGQIATLLDMPENTVKSHLYRARRQIAASVGDSQRPKRETDGDDHSEACDDTRIPIKSETGLRVRQRCLMSELKAFLVGSRRWEW